MARPSHALYGLVPSVLAADRIIAAPPGALQCSPLVPPSLAGGADIGALADMTPGTLQSITIHAPANTLERRRLLALALQALAPGGAITAFAANDKGGTRLADELAAFGCIAEGIPKRHHRIVTALRPDEQPAARRPRSSRVTTMTGSGLNAAAIAAAITDGDARIVPGLMTADGLWSMPGLFHWDGVDPGTALLIEHLPPLTGRGIDLGCGIGLLAKAVLERGACTHITLADIDRRALDLACRNIAEDAAHRSAGIAAVWTDVRTARDLPTGLDFAVMNPPFHDGGVEDRALGQAFITRAAQILKPGGQLWMTANRHLPYEATLEPLFESVEIVVQAGGYKIASASKPARPNRRTPRQTDTVGGAFGRKPSATAQPASDSTAPVDGVEWNGVVWPTFEADEPKRKHRRASIMKPVKKSSAAGRSDVGKATQSRKPPKPRPRGQPKR